VPVTCPIRGAVAVNCGDYRTSLRRWGRSALSQVSGALRNRLPKLIGQVQYECSASTVVTAYQATAAGARTPAARVAARRHEGFLRPRTKITTAAASRNHWPSPPAQIHERAAAHGLQDPPQLNLSVQSEPMPNAFTNQPNVPSTKAARTATELAEIRAHRGQILRRETDAALTPTNIARPSSPSEWQGS